MAKVHDSIGEEMKTYPALTRTLMESAEAQKARADRAFYNDMFAHHTESYFRVKKMGEKQPSRKRMLEPLLDYHRNEAARYGSLLMD